MASRDWDHLVADIPVLLLLEWFAARSWCEGTPPALHTEGRPQLFLVKDTLRQRDYLPPIDLDACCYCELVRQLCQDGQP